MELKGMFVPQFHGVPMLRMTRKLVKRAKCNSNSPVCDLRVSSNHFRESFPVLRGRCNTVKVHCTDSTQSTQKPSVSNNESSRISGLAFERLQQSDQEHCGEERRSFGRFTARGAALDEEYWTAAWLRAEAHWESMSHTRHVDSYKRKYAEQEYNALKRRCSGRDGNSLKCFCLVTVKKEDKNVRRTVLNSVVGTLDISIRQFLQGETLPGETKRSSIVLASHEANGAHKYAYVANVCVSKFARRQGIASNMMYLATDLAISAGMKQLFVHVNADNKPAQDLYKKTGFEVIEAAPFALLKDQRLMYMQL